VLFRRVVILVVTGVLLGLAWNALSGRGMSLTRHAFIHEGDEIIDVAEAKRRFDRGALFIDARARIVFEFGHVPGAVPLPETEFESAFPSLERVLRGRLDIVVYCDGYGCESSHIVARKLKKEGIPAVVLDNGLPSWVETGYPTKTGAVS
jgi:rhodanese-related sulfurtransferase